MVHGVQSPSADTATVPQTSPYGVRRWIFLSLVLVTIGVLSWVMTGILGSGGWTWPEIGMMVAFLATLPWLAIGFWNAMIGLVILKAARDPAVYVTPAWADARGSGAVTQKTALAMTVRHEAIGPVIDRLDQLYRDLSLRPEGPLFSVHLLSDSTDPEFAKAEEQAVADWRARLGPALATRVHYRRREQNTGFKAGNLAEFADRMGEEVDFFLPLDADSAMSADAVLRLVRVMEAHPEIGLLQGLVVGAPTASLFARMFQFGMRQGMRSYTTGSAWWQGDCGPFWGHNAVVRIKPFRDHCRLPVLPGSSALSGPILSHDQVEAVLLRRAGYEVRVVAQEEESYEENPPSLLDFIKRDLRWCHGNMQYFKLLGMPKLHLLGRVQLALAVLMYAGAPAWMAFILFGAAQAFHPAGFDTYSIDGLWLFLAIMVMTLFPKIMGVADILSSRLKRRAYGGSIRVTIGAMVEFVFSMLLAPVVSFAVTVFLGKLVLGRSLRWSAQLRDAHGVAWSEAAARLWPQTLFGVLLAATLALQAPHVLPWAAPVLLAFLLCIPVTVITASVALGRQAQQVGLCAIPEDRMKEIELADDLQVLEEIEATS